MELISCRRDFSLIIGQRARGAHHDRRPRWVERNLGFDPVATVVPHTTFASAAAAAPTRTPEDLQREVIDFDSQGSEGHAFLAFTTAMGLSRFTDIPWPDGLAPVTAPNAGGRAGGPLPKADVLVVTWTVDEGHALSRVLTPGKDSRNDYLAYTHNFETISAGMTGAAPAVKAKRLGAYWMTTIGRASVLVLKSESHLSQDTSKTLPKDGAPLPNALFWKQIIKEVEPKLVITTGTGGAIGPQFEVGDVIVSPVVRFTSRKWLKDASFGEAHFADQAVDATDFAIAETLFAANAGRLPKDNTRAPRIVNISPRSLSASIVTTDFFGFDTSSDFYKLQGLGDLSEMGDAVLGMVAADLRDEGARVPPWVAVRNVSDPQIASGDLTIQQQADMAAQIYKGFGRWSSVCSAIVCWALIAAL